MRQINDTTFISDNLGDLKPVVTIGGKPVDKFIPNLNMSFHDDEFFINLNRKDKQATSATDKAEIDGIDKDIFYIDENGRFKWDIEFKERPSKNSWTWELKHAEGIEFYYQDTLENEYYKLDEEYKKLVSLEEYLSRCNRPIEVVGSYAVYCNKVNNKYKTGKLCHIYRPFCYDINRESIYADLKIADGQLTISIDEAWLDNAVYPVRLDPTFGHTTKGATAELSDGVYVWGTRFTPSSSGSATSITGYVQTSNSGADWDFALYQYGSPCSLLSDTDNGSGINDNWSELSLSSDSSIQADTEYVLVVSGENGSGVYFYRDTGGSSNQQGYTNKGFWSSWPSELSFTFANSIIFSIYATYTESGGSSLPTIINNYRQQGVM